MLILHFLFFVQLTAEILPFFIQTSCCLFYQWFYKVISLRFQSPSNSLPKSLCSFLCSLFTVLKNKLTKVLHSLIFSNVVLMFYHCYYFRFLCYTLPPPFIKISLADEVFVLQQHLRACYEKINATLIIQAQHIFFFSTYFQLHTDEEILITLLWSPHC